MQLLLDTHILVWIVLDDPRLSEAQRRLLEDPENRLLLSPVVTYEITHLQRAGRIPLSESIDRLQQLVGFELIDIPQDIWRAVAELPDIHRDPLDRLLIAHALTEGMTLVTADDNIRRYPVPFV